MHKIFYHNDMDGMASKFIVKYFLTTREYVDPKYIQEFCMNFTDRDKDYLDGITKEDDVYIVDYSFTTKTIDQLLKAIENSRSIVWIDHHDTSVGIGLQIYDRHVDLYKKLRYYVSKDGSGAYLTWKFFFENTDAPYWIELVSDYDTWAFKHGIETTCFKLVFDAAIDKDQFMTELMVNPNYTLESLVTGSTIKKYIDQDNKFYLNSYGYESQLPDGTPIYVINKSSNSWIFGDKYNQYKAVVTFVFDGKYYKYSLFSGDADFDCSKWALEFGGGGHKKSAGWKSKDLMFKATNK